MFYGNVLIVFVILIVVGSSKSQAHCPDGWTYYMSNCYFFTHHDLTFIESQRFCEHYGAHLVVIESADENNFIAGVLEELISQRHWIGLTDEIVEGVWKWYATDIVAGYTDWYPGQPDLGALANCANILSVAPYKYHWLDDECTYKFRAICEKRLDAETEVVGK